MGNSRVCPAAENKGFQYCKEHRELLPNNYTAAGCQVCLRQSRGSRFLQKGSSQTRWHACCQQWTTFDDDTACLAGTQVCNCSNYNCRPQQCCRSYMTVQDFERQTTAVLTRDSSCCSTSALTLWQYWLLCMLAQERLWVVCVLPYGLAHSSCCPHL
jgi:hypothetical protein